MRVGFDLVCVDDIADSVRDHGERYLARIFTPRERSDCQDAPQQLAVRFAAKEAAMKVLRPGSGDAIPWATIEAATLPGGGIGLRLTGRAASLAEAADLGGFVVSVATAGGTATAVVIATTGAGDR